MTAVGSKEEMNPAKLILVREALNEYKTRTKMGAYRKK
jgi:hypothetical protein